MPRTITSVSTASRKLLPISISKPYVTIRIKCRNILKRTNFKNDKDEDITRPRAITVFLSLILLVIFLVVSILGLFFPTILMKRVVISVNVLCSAILVVVLATDLFTLRKRFTL